MTSPAARLRRLDQLLASCGYCSRREAKGWLKRGWVTVDGVVESSPDRKVDPAVVRIEGEPVDHPDGLVVVMHKPVGTVCTHDGEEGKTVYELLPERWRSRNPCVNSVGRLDKDSSGVLVLTDQGHLVQQWTSPRHHVSKVYEVVLDRAPDPEWIPLFASGILVLPGEDRPCAPARLELTGPDRVRLELTEGRFHQVKRMFAFVGALVTGLHRTRFGAFELGDLAPGSWREATAGELGANVP